MCLQPLAASCSASVRVAKAYNDAMRATTILAAVAGAALAFAPVAGAAGTSAQSAVYKCKQADGAVSYQDYSCNGGIALDIKPDAADPVAIQRLQRANAEFDRAAARRKASEDAAARRQQELDQRRREIDAAQRLAESGGAYASDVPAYGYYAPHVIERANRQQPRARAKRRISPDSRVRAVVRRADPH